VWQPSPCNISVIECQGNIFVFLAEQRWSKINVRFVTDIYFAISQKRWEVWPRLLLISNRKSVDIQIIDLGWPWRVITHSAMPISCRSRRWTLLTYFLSATGSPTQAFGYRRRDRPTLAGLFVICSIYNIQIFN